MHGQLIQGLIMRSDGLLQALLFLFGTLAGLALHHIAGADEGDGAQQGCGLARLVAQCQQLL